MDDHHDDWFLQWIETGINPSNWTQGQKATGMSYLEHSRPGHPWYEFNFDKTGFDEDAWEGVGESFFAGLYTGLGAGVDVAERLPES